MTNINFGRLENLMYACRMNLWWYDDEGFTDLREAEVVSIKDNEITLKDSDNLYWSYDIDVLEAKLEMLAEQHADDLRSAFKKLKEEGVIG